MSLFKKWYKENTGPYSVVATNVHTIKFYAKLKNSNGMMIFNHIVYSKIYLSNIIT